MADNHSKEVRSMNMSHIRSQNTKPEEIVRKYLFSKGFRYRKNDKRYPGSPDIVLPKYKTVVFINGCFWHKHEGCNSFIWPQNNAAYWKEKIEKNVKRDQRNYELLHQMGWTVVIIWECSLRPKLRDNTLNKLFNDLEASNGSNK